MHTLMYRSIAIEREYCTSEGKRMHSYSYDGMQHCRGRISKEGRARLLRCATAPLLDRGMASNLCEKNFLRLSLLLSHRQSSL